MFVTVIKVLAERKKKAHRHLNAVVIVVYTRARGLIAFAVVLTISTPYSRSSSYVILFVFHPLI
jgi:hypothetical protein